MSHPLARRLTLAALTAATTAFPVAAAAAAPATTPHSSGLVPNVQLPFATAQRDAGVAADAPGAAAPAQSTPINTGNGSSGLNGLPLDLDKLLGGLGLGSLGKPGHGQTPGQTPGEPQGGADALGQLGRGDHVSGLTQLDSDRLLSDGLVGGLLTPLRTPHQVNTGGLLSPDARSARPAARDLLPALDNTQGSGGDLLTEITRLINQLTHNGQPGQPGQQGTPPEEAGGSL